jgi:cysteine synthase
MLTTSHGQMVMAQVAASLQGYFGNFVGPSSGAHLVSARTLRSKYKLENVFTFFCDDGEKYINDYWL